MGTHLAWLEFIFDTMLKAFALDLHRCEHQAVAHKVCGIADALRCLEAMEVGEREIIISREREREREIAYYLPIEIRLLTLNVHRVNWIQSKPGGKCKSILVGPLGQRWQYHGL